MIASVMTTSRAGRPIECHIPRRLKSMAVDYSSVQRGLPGLKRRRSLHTAAVAVNARNPKRALQHFDLLPQLVPGRRQLGRERALEARARAVGMGEAQPGRVEEVAVEAGQRRAAVEIVAGER